MVSLLRLIISLLHVYIMVSYSVSCRLYLSALSVDIRRNLFVSLFHFRRAMLCISAAIAVMQCPSVCLSVRLSVTFVSCAKTNTDIFDFFYHRVAKPFQFFHAKRDGDILTGTTLMGASNAGGV